MILEDAAASTRSSIVPTLKQDDTMQTIPANTYINVGKVSRLPADADDDEEEEVRPGPNVYENLPKGGQMSPALPPRDPLHHRPDATYAQVDKVTKAKHPVKEIQREIEI